MKGIWWSLPSAPLSEVNPSAARHWSLLEKARHIIPLRATFTVRSATPESEMELFVLAQGVLVRRVSLPSSYRGEPKGEGSGAEYVIADTRLKPDRTLLSVAEFPEGIVYRRLRR